MRSIRMFLTVVFGAVMVSGCQAPRETVMHGKYAKIQEQGSDREQVEELLGVPDHRIGDTWMYSHPDRHLTVVIEFDGEGRVIRKQWIDGESGRWEDSEDRK